MRVVKPYCGATVGGAGHFNSSVDGNFASDFAGAKGGCNDDSWADAEDAAHGSGTAFSLEGLVDRMNRFDWTAGIVMYQRRVQALSASECSLPVYGDRCMPDLAASYVALGLNCGRRSGRQRKPT